MGEQLDLYFPSKGSAMDFAHWLQDEGLEQFLQSDQHAKIGEPISDIETFHLPDDDPDAELYIEFK